jgi:hypothetical protein
MISTKNKLFIWLLLWVFGFAYLALIYTPVWGISAYDAADYVFLAEHFWGVPHSGNYGFDFSSEWREFLSNFPFRQIGVGSVYLILKFFLGDSVLKLGPYVLQFLLIATYIWLGSRISRQTGLTAGIASVVVLVGTTYLPASGAMIFTEPFIRMFLVILTGLIVFNKDEDRAPYRLSILLPIVALFLVHFKMQWIIFVVLIISYEAVELIRRPSSKYELGVFLILTLMIPISLLAVNVIGWNCYTIGTAGYGLHAMNMEPGSGAQFLKISCEIPGLFSHQPKYCAEQQYIFSTWADFLRFQYADQSIKELIAGLDRLASMKSNYTIGSIFETVYAGIPDITNFPFIESKGILFYLARSFDLLVGCICLIGLYFKKNRWAGAFFIALLIVTLAGRHVAFWDVRYLTTFAGLPIIIAAKIFFDIRTLILVGPKQPLKN